MLRMESNLTKDETGYTRQNHRADVWLAFSWVTAAIATLSALFIGEVLGQTPCLLCWYQRIFMFPLAWLLGLAAYRGDYEIWRYALPLSIAGGVFAGYHTLLYWGIIEPEVIRCSAELSCSGDGMTILGRIPIPFLALVAFFVITIALFLVRRCLNK